MRNQICLMLLLIALGSSNLTIQAQSTDLARVEYTYFPQSTSDNSFRRFKTFVNFPIKTGGESYLVPGLEYENVNFKFIDDTPFDKRGELDRYQSFSFSLGYTFLIGNDWRFAGQGGAMLTSNFETGTVKKDDLLYTGSVFAIKDRTGADDTAPKPWRLIVGLHYSTTSGFPFPLPVVNYYREFRPNWSYSLGVPKTNIKYSFNEKNHVQAFATLDGFYANIQENRLVSTSGEMAENISMTIVLGGLGYEYDFTEHLVYYLYAGHTIMNDIRLRDDDKEDVYTINKTNTFYARSGLKIKI